MQVLDSFIDAALSLQSRRAGDELIGMIVRYLRTGAEPSPRTEAQRAVLLAVRPSMDNSKARIEAGSRGGRSPSKQASKQASKTGAGRQANAQAKKEEEEESASRGFLKGCGSSQPETGASRRRPQGGARRGDDFSIYD